ncbi:putative quinol monooxygenase [Aquibium microcysteis]|uniref:putative quinol monooxygenase n=1 Tax=Aquibium microcysteis TaxID=675281 RepID=UPI001EF1ED75|nr:antibiotic biosynthesis monooxygenase [Aquibium microcysteis]
MDEQAIIVEYEIEEGRIDAFRALVLDHARRTLAEEQGCLRFEVLEPVDRQGEPIPNRLMVSEIYASPLAVEQHGQNPRLERVRAAMAPLVKSRRLVMARVLDHVRAEEGIRPEHLTAANDD